MKYHPGCFTFFRVSITFATNNNRDNATWKLIEENEIRADDFWPSLGDINASKGRNTMLPRKWRRFLNTEIFGYQSSSGWEKESNPKRHVNTYYHTAPSEAAAVRGTEKRRERKARGEKESTMVGAVFARDRAEVNEGKRRKKRKTERDGERARCPNK